MLGLGVLSALSHATQDSDANNMHQCSQPRPEVCTMEYNPVCANLETGKTKLFSNVCSACADEKVESYFPAPCEKKQKKMDGKY